VLVKLLGNLSAEEVATVQNDTVYCCAGMLLVSRSKMITYHALAMNVVLIEARLRVLQQHESMLS